MGNDRTEDEIIAWTWRSYITDYTDTPQVIARMPMTKVSLFLCLCLYFSLFHPLPPFLSLIIAAGLVVVLVLIVDVVVVVDDVVFIASAAVVVILVVA